MATEIVDLAKARAAKEAQQTPGDAVFDAVAEDITKIFDSASNDDPRALAISHLFASISAQGDFVQAQIDLQETPASDPDTRKKLEANVAHRQGELAKIQELVVAAEKRFTSTTSEPGDQSPSGAEASTQENPYLKTMNSLEKELLPKLLTAQEPMTKKRLSPEIAANKEAVYVLTLGDAVKEVYMRVGMRSILRPGQQPVASAPQSKAA